MSIVSNNYIDVYNDIIEQGPTANSLNGFTDCQSSNNTLTLGYRHEFDGVLNLNISNNINFSDTNSVIASNTCVGQNSGLQLSSGSAYNTGLGFNSLRHAQNSSNNVAIGFNALSSTMDLCNSNTALGFQALEKVANGCDECLGIGTNCLADIVETSRCLGIGNNILQNDFENSIAIGNGVTMSDDNSVFILPSISGVVNNNLSYLMGTNTTTGQWGKILLPHSVSSGFLKHGNSGYTWDPDPSSNINYASFGYLANTGVSQNVTTDQDFLYTNFDVFNVYGTALSKPFDLSKYFKVEESGFYLFDVILTVNTITMGATKLNAYVVRDMGNLNTEIEYFDCGGANENTTSLQVGDQRLIHGRLLMEAYTNDLLQLHINNTNGVEVNLTNVSLKVTKLN